MHSNLIAPHLQTFFAEYLCQQKRQSPKTIRSCRDTFRLLLTFVRDHTGIEPSALRIADLDAPVVLRFLNYLEQERGNSVRSRNIRLSALRSFFGSVPITCESPWRHNHSDFGGTRKLSNSSIVQMWSVKPAAIAGVTTFHFL